MFLPTGFPAVFQRYTGWLLLPDVAPLLCGLCRYAFITVLQGPAFCAGKQPSGEQLHPAYIDVSGMELRGIEPQLVDTSLPQRVGSEIEGVFMPFAVGYGWDCNCPLPADEHLFRKQRPLCCPEIQTDLLRFIELRIAPGWRSYSHHHFEF